MIAMTAAMAGGLYLAPELSGRLLKPGSRVPDQVNCVLVICEQKPVYPVTYGATVLAGPMAMRVRRTTFVNHRPDARPYILDLRVHPWFVTGYEHENFWIPTEEIHPVVGLRYVNDTGDGPDLRDGYALQLGVEAFYTNDGFPEGTGGYTEFLYLRYVAAGWSRRRSGRPGYGGFVFRTGAQLGPLQFGANVTGDPGFGFSAMIEVGTRFGVRLMQ